MRDRCLPLLLSTLLFGPFATPVTRAGDDIDGDGIPDSDDNCPTVANPLQQDSESPGAIAVWRLDEGTGGTAADSFGTHDGMIIDGTWVSGLFGYALAFDGMDDPVFHETLRRCRSLRWRRAGGKPGERRLPLAFFERRLAHRAEGWSAIAGRLAGIFQRVEGGTR